MTNYYVNKNGLEKTYVEKISTSKNEKILYDNKTGQNIYLSKNLLNKDYEKLKKDKEGYYVSSKDSREIYYYNKNGEYQLSKIK